MLGVDEATGAPVGRPRNPVSAAWRAQVEGPAFQSSGPDVVLGGGGFADDSAPPGALLQLGADAPLALGIRAARAGSARTQGRNSTVPLSHPVAVPEGDWALTLQTTWVEPAYVEPDASWSRPDHAPASPLANGGAFGGKRRSPVPARARQLADDSGDVVRVLWRREDVVRRGPKRPPLAVALRPDGSGLVQVGRTPGSTDLEPLAAAVRARCPGVQVEQVDVTGPPVSPDLRGAGWAEVLAAQAVLGAPAVPAGTGQVHLAVPGAGSARVELQLAAGSRGRVEVDVWAGEVLCGVTLRSYALGAVHQALGLVWSEGIAVDGAGEPVDLTIRSFGILGARDMPEVTVRLHDEEGWPVNGSDAVFVATLAAAWIAEGLPGRWPTRRDALRWPSRDVAPSRQLRGARMSPAVGPYSPVRRVGDWVITSGQVGLAIDSAGAPGLVAGGTLAELRQALQNVAEVLAAEGATLRDVVKTTLYVVDMSEFAAVNEVWVEFFTENRPTRSAVAVAALPIGARVEVEAWAYAPVV